MTVTLVAVLDSEPELGRQRWCNECGEWWPLDRDFWYFFTGPAGPGTRPAHVCRACWDLRTRERKAASS